MRGIFPFSHKNAKVRSGYLVIRMKISVFIRRFCGFVMN
jgi:hypothetical protein